MMFRGQFSDFFLGTQLPFLRIVIQQRYSQYAHVYDKIFDIQSSTRSMEQTSEISGIGLLQNLNEGDPVEFDSMVQGYKQNFLHGKKGIGYQFTRDMIEDDQFSIVTRANAELGRSVFETIEISAASTLNNAFSASYVGGDAVSLCNSSHPLPKAGGVQSNVGAIADLDVTSLSVALTAFETQKNITGQIVHMPVKNLIVAPANRWIAYQTVKSSDRPDTANRATNPLQYAEDGLPDPLVWRYLTDSAAWFLTGPPAETGLVWWWRRKPYIKGWVDDSTETAKTAIRYRESHGFYTYQGVYGVPSH